MNAALWFLITLLLLVALGALAYVYDLIRRAVLGDRLLEACGGDWDSAVKAIDSVRAENELLAEAAARAFKPRALRLVNQGRPVRFEDGAA